jgi:hypothetical protein
MRHTLGLIKTAFTIHKSSVEIQMNCIIIYVFEMLNNFKRVPLNEIIKHTTYMGVRPIYICHGITKYYPYAELLVNFEIISERLEYYVLQMTLLQVTPLPRLCSHALAPVSIRVSLFC